MYMDENQNEELNEYVNESLNECINEDEEKVHAEKEVAGSNEVKRSEKKKGMNSYVKMILCSILCGAIIGGMVLGAFAIGKNTTSNPQIASTEERLASDASEAIEVPGPAVIPEIPKTLTDDAEGYYTVSQIAKQCSPSVVAITSMGISEIQTMFGTYQQESEGSGSGVIIGQNEKELLIATNNHVVEGADQLSVCFNDSQENVYTALVKGTDANNDLAVVAVNLSDIDETVLNSITIASLGDSDSLTIGDQVVAIGNALGMGQSVTTGIISAKDREVTIESVTTTLLQTDAAINPGNSGGALFNMKGELIGINSAKYASASVEGMGFAIPINTANGILENLMSRETRVKLESGNGCLNISGADVSAEAAEMYQVPEGAYVASVVEGGAADHAGIQKGDIITTIDGIPVKGVSDIRTNLQYYAAGEEIEVVFQRQVDGKYQEMTVKVILDNADDQIR